MYYWREGREDGKGGEFKELKIPILTRLYSVERYYCFKLEFPPVLVREVPTCSQIWRGRTGWFVVGCFSLEKTCCRSAEEPGELSHDETED